MKQKLEKFKQFIYKHDELFFIILFLIMISGFALNLYTVPGDEVWNFQNIYKMYNGHKIYTETNIITTPLFHIIGVLLFKIFGANFFILRIYNIIMCLILFLLAYKILKRMGVPKIYSFIMVSLLFIIEKDIILMIANYNLLVMIFVLSGVYNILNREKYKYYKFWQAILITLIILSKQNIGLFYAIGYILYTIIITKKNKEMFNIFTKVLIFLILFMISLKIYGNLEGFINYCILGINEFANNNFSSIFYVIFMIVLSFTNIALLIYINYFKKGNIKLEEKININIFSIFTFPVLIMTYPIFNSSHIKIAIFMQYILIFYIIYTLIKNSEKIAIKSNIKKVIFIIIILIDIIYVIKSTINTVNYFEFIKKDNYKYSDAYFGTIFTDEIKEKINKITDYIIGENANVIILSSEASIYTIPLNITYGPLDLPLMGNLGKDGEKYIITELYKNKDKKILLKKEKYSWQESDNVINYVKNNFNYIGEIEDFEIYKIK